MKRWILAAIACAVLALLALCGRHRGEPADPASTVARDPSSAALASRGSRHADPRTLPRASIAGTIRAEDRTPIAGARVCVDLDAPDAPRELVRDPRCTTSDAHGRYAVEDLWPGLAQVSAMARTYRPAVYHPAHDRRRDDVPLAAGQHRTDVDLVLGAGGVALTGAVNDIAGGPIAHALVRTHHLGKPGAAIEADDAGAFELWVAPGEIDVIAVADGYAPAEVYTRAPARVTLRLTPESSLAGTIVDAGTGDPVAAVHVHLTGELVDDSLVAISDEHGRFRVTRLAPGRYGAIARSPRGYGKSEGTTRVGLAQHVDGVVVTLYPAFRVAGVVAAPGAAPETCRDAQVELRSPAARENVALAARPDGTHDADGVLPGRYQVEVSCAGFRARDHYPAIEIVDRDVLDQVWQVDAGAVVLGQVRTSSGTPIDDASVTVRTINAAARARSDWTSDRTTRDGKYELAGVTAGSYQLDVEAAGGIAPKDGWKITVPSATATVVQDLVLDEGGAIEGVLVDATGKAVPGATIHVAGLGDASAMTERAAATREDGSFALHDVQPGEYRVVAYSAWDLAMRRPGTTDDAKQGERTTVHAGRTSSVRLIVEPLAGKITGTVEDAAGKPVNDAFVVAQRESDAAGSRSAVLDARWSDDHPVLTGIDGGFTVGGLSPGTYTLFAERRGGSEGVREHVRVGETARVRIRPTGTIEGTVRRDGGAPVELHVGVADRTTGVRRYDAFFHTDGRYAIRDLPPGHFTISYAAEGGQNQQVVDLAEGEHRTGVDIALDPLATITGRVVELGTRAPAPGIMVVAAAGNTGGWSFAAGFDDEDQANVTDESGRFTITNAPRGTVTISGFPKDWQDAPYGFVRAVRQISGAGPVDVGELAVAHRRTKPGEPVGELGVHWAAQTPGADIEHHVWKISWIDPSGPAAKTDLRVGDVVVTVDGNDITGAAANNGEMLLEAPPGTVVRLGLARGETVAITLAPPS